MNMQDRAETTQSCRSPAAEADKPEVDVFPLHDCTQEASGVCGLTFCFCAGSGFLCGLTLIQGRGVLNKVFCEVICFLLLPPTVS